MSSTREKDTNVALPLSIVSLFISILSYMKTQKAKINLDSKTVNTVNGVYCEPYTTQLFAIPHKRALIVTYLSGGNICFEAYDLKTSTDEGNYVLLPDGTISHYHNLEKTDTALTILYVTT